MSGRRVIFRNKGAAPTAAPVKPVSVRMPTAPVMFVKAITPAPDPLDALPEPDPGFDFGKPVTGYMHDLLCKGLHDGRVSVSDVVRANQAFICGRPLPYDLIDLVVALA